MVDTSLKAEVSAKLQSENINKLTIWGQFPSPYSHRVTGREHSDTCIHHRLHHSRGPLNLGNPTFIMDIIYAYPFAPYKYGWGTDCG